LQFAVCSWQFAVGALKGQHNLAQGFYEAELVKAAPCLPAVVPGMWDEGGKEALEAGRELLESMHPHGTHSGATFRAHFFDGPTQG
jgi:hypothetical protein